VRISVLTLEGSLYGIKLLNLLRWSHVEVAQVVVFSATRQRNVRILRAAARRMGWPNAVWCAVLRLYWLRQATKKRWRGRPLEGDYGKLALRVDRVSGPKAPETVELLRAGRPDVCLLGHSGIVPPAVLAIPKYATLNAHPGILPEYRGMDPGFYAILDGRFDQVGCTLHEVNEGIDTGRILKRRYLRWTGTETMANFDQCLNEDCLDLLAEACQAQWPELLANGVPQPSGGNYYHLMGPGLLRRTGRKLKRHLAGMAYGDSCTAVKESNG
jgi:methionyl-tRNA formyltransferase